MRNIQRHLYKKHFNNNLLEYHMLLTRLAQVVLDKFIK